MRRLGESLPLEGDPEEYLMCMNTAERQFGGKYDKYIEISKCYYSKEIKKLYRREK